MPTSIGAASRGHGFAWLPEDKIREELAAGQVKVLPLRDGKERVAQCYLLFADRDAAGPGTLRLAHIIRERVAAACKVDKHATQAQARTKAHDRS